MAAWTCSRFVFGKTFRSEIHCSASSYLYIIARLGVLGVGSLSENAFTDNDAELLNQVGTQVAIAVENALSVSRD